MTTETTLNASIVAIHDPRGNVVGTGFFALPNLILTCAHVVLQAGSGPDRAVAVRFHATRVTGAAQVLAEAWSEPGERDIAVLRLSDGPPSGIIPLRLAQSSADLAGHLFRTLGYPDIGDRTGVFASGNIEGVSPNSLGQYLLQLTSANLASGMSGAPVVDENSGLVVGMVTGVYIPDWTTKHRDTAFAIPSEALGQVCPQLELYSIPAGSATVGVGIQATDNLTIGGDVVARDKITQIVQGIGDLPSRYDGAVRNFLEYYLGTPEQPAPFGGRQDDLDRLNAWLADPTAPRCALLTAPAGRGKSALLAHWVAQLEGRADLHVVYFPISIRYATNRDVVTFSALAARLAHIYGEKMTQAFDASQYKGVALDYLRRPPEGGGTVLVVLDGLDEAAWEIGADLFPTEPPAHLRVLVAARPLAGDAGSEGWLSRLGWERPGRALGLGLRNLDLSGVRDVLAQMGDPLEGLGARFDLVARLVELSEGDPLLVRMYVEALLPQGEQAALIKPDELAGLKPGLKAYLDRWLADQRQLWGVSTPLREQSVKTLLALCATALGPLRRDDVLAIARSEIPDSFVLAEAVRAVGRLLNGDGDTIGYTFSHPRLRDYFSEALTPQESKAWQKRFLEFGETTLVELRSGERSPAEASEYIVRYYGAHLESAKARQDQIYALSTESWLRAWEWVDGTPDGFLSDALRGWNIARQSGGEAVAQIVRVALCISSVTTLSTNIDDKLLIRGIESKAISPRLALILARRKPSLEDKIRALLIVQRFLPADERDTTLAETLRVAQDLSDESSRTRAITSILYSLSEKDTVLLESSLNVIRDIGDGQQRAEILCIFALRCPVDRRRGVLLEALDALHGIQEDVLRSRAIRYVADLILTGDRGLLDRLLTAVESMTDEASMSSALTKLAGHLLANDFDAKTRVLTIARSIRDDQLRIDTLCLLVEGNPALAGEFLSDVAGAAKSISDEAVVFRVVRAVMRWSSTEEMGLRASIFELASSIGDARWRAKALLELAQHSSPETRSVLLEEALRVAWSVPDPVDRTLTLCDVADQLIDENKTETLIGAAIVARTIEDDDIHDDVIDAIASRCSPRTSKSLAAAVDVSKLFYGGRMYTKALAETLRQTLANVPQLFGEVLQAIREVRSEESQSRILQSLAEQLPLGLPIVKNEVLDLIRGISNGEYRASALVAIAKVLPEDELTLILEEALQAARSIANEYMRQRVLCEVASLHADPMRLVILEEAIEAAISTSYVSERVAALLEVANHMTGERRIQLLVEAVNSARSIADDSSRVSTLIALVTELPANERSRILEYSLNVLESIPGAHSRAESLNATLTLIGAENPSCLSRVRELALSIDDEARRISVLCGVAEKLPSSDQEGLLAEVLEDIASIRNEEKKGKAIDIATQYFSTILPSQMGALLKITRSMSQETERVKALASIARSLPVDEKTAVLNEALDIIRETRDEATRARSLQLLIGQLSAETPDVAREALEIVRSIADLRSNSVVLRNVASCLPESERLLLLEESLEFARAIRDAVVRAHYIVAIAQKLPTDGQRAALAEALDSFRMIEDEGLRIQNMLQAAAHFPPISPELLDEAVTIARTIKDDGMWPGALCLVADHMAMADRIALLSEALNRVGDIAEEDDYGYALSILAQSLPTEASNLFKVIMDKVPHIGPNDSCTDALLALSRRIPVEQPELRLHVLELVSQLRFAEHTSHIVGNLVPDWSAVSEVAERTEVGLFADTLWAFAHRGRSELIQIISALIPLIKRLGGERAVRGTADAIIDTAKWWP